jgi:hypothetical protein
MNPVREIITGAAALADWLGEGGVPVHPMLADFRAQRCTLGNNGKACPNNKEPNWWGRVKHTIADWIRKELELKENLKLEVSVEQELHMCSACGCCLRLKVWTPAKHLREHTTQETLDKMPAYCWFKKELP